MVVPPLLPRSKKLRTALLAGASIVVVVVVALLLASTADSGKTHTPAKAAKAKAAKAKAGSLTLVIGPVDIQSAGPPASVGAPVRRALMAATQQYFDDAIQAPLTKGAVNAAYTKVFDPGVKGAATGKDRAALTESATGVIRRPVRMSASPVRMDALGDPTGKLALVATTFSLRVDANTPTGRLTIQRHTELTFANEFGRWVVTAYRVTVKRSLGPKTTTTTARSGPGTTA
jgi:hypothetical protein